ncbi:MAG: hypothetical protein QM820_35055 [Minicystis sp.]
MNRRWTEAQRASGQQVPDDGQARPLYEHPNILGPVYTYCRHHKEGDPDVITAFCEPDISVDDRMDRLPVIHIKDWGLSMFALTRGATLLEDTDRLEIEGKLTNSARLNFVRSVAGQCVPESSPSRPKTRDLAGYHFGGTCEGAVDPAFLPIAAMELQKVDWGALIRDVDAKAPEHLKHLAAGQIHAIRVHLTKELSSVSPDAVAAAKKSYDEWMALYGANKAMMDSALSVIWKELDTGAREQTPCPPGLRSQLEALVQAKAPKTFASAYQAVDDPVGYVAVDALRRCERTGGQAAGPWFFMYNRLEPAGRHWRGPRRYAALKAKANPPSSVQRHERLTIKSVEKKGGAVLVSFKTESWLEEGWSCRDTNRVDSIYWNGTEAKVQYQQQCTSIGMVRKEKTYDPAWLEGKYAGVLKPGQGDRPGRGRDLAGVSRHRHGTLPGPESLREGHRPARLRERDPQVEDPASRQDAPYACEDSPSAGRSLLSLLNLYPWRKPRPSVPSQVTWPFHPLSIPRASGTIQRALVSAWIGSTP